MDYSARQIRDERNEAHQRRKFADQELRTAEQGINKYSGFPMEPPAASDEGGELMIRRAMDAWAAATRNFAEAARDFMSATDELNVLGIS